MRSRVLCLRVGGGGGGVGFVDDDDVRSSRGFDWAARAMSNGRDYAFLRKSR
jgi:hypothetical protein